MTIQWGGNSTLRVGLDVFTDGYDTYTPSINVYIDVYVGSDNFNYSDNQHVQLSGSISQGFDFTNNLPRAPGATQYVGRAVIAGQGQSYGGGPGYTFTAQVSGAFNGAAPSVSVGFTLPARPIRAPSAPSPPSVSSIQATTCTINIGGSGDDGGSGENDTWLRIATDAGYANVVWQDPYGTPVYSMPVSGLVPNTTYYCQSANHNAAGWGAFSASTSFATNAYQAGAPSWSISGPTTATLTWAAPGASPGPSQYHLQIATDSAFSHVIGDFTNTWATTFNATGLAPATTYYARVAANSGTGWGVWSPVTSSTTLSGAKVRVAGAWQNTPAYARVNGAWQAVKVNKRVNGAWQL